VSYDPNTDPSDLAPLLGGVGLLERAINYALGALHLVTREDLAAPTPCRSWDLRALLGHVDESLRALHEAGSCGRVPLTPAPPGPADPVAAVRAQASRVLSAWTHTRRAGVTVGDADVSSGIVATAGALEVAVHGWDVARTAGPASSLPPVLARELLELSPFLVCAADRPLRFAEPAEVPAHAPASDRLLAFLGRHP
jgi:uncharacterized protein (TIGR03086 family)